MGKSLQTRVIFLLLIYMKAYPIILIIISAATFSAAAQPDQVLTREIFKELIEINTTNSTGNTTKAAEAMAARLRAAGFTDQDIFIGGPDEKSGNLVARMKGSGKKKPLLLLAYLDVVEALRQDWTTDPF